MTKSIIVNCRFLTQPVTGVQRFAIEICKQLKKLQTDVLFVAPKNIVDKSLAQELEVIELGFLKGHLWEQIELVSYIKSKKGILLSLSNTAPLFLNDQIITIHDLGFLTNPEWFSYGFRNFYNFLIPKIAKKANHIFTVSETSKKEITKRLHVEDTKVTVIYNAVAPVFKTGINNNGLVVDTPKRYILSVSSHNPRKNFKRLIEAFLEMEIPDLKLVIIGNFNRYSKEVKINVSDRIIIMENLGDEELKVFYKNAELFVYPSVYEGFGLPIIEALSFGTNVCVSDIEVFKEICGQHATYFDPYNVEQIKLNILKALKKTNKDYSEHLKKYSWEIGAKKMLNKLTELEMYLS